MQALRLRLPLLCAFVFAFLALAGCSDAQKKVRAMERADRLYSEEEFEKAKVEYLNVLRFDPKDAKANQRLGQIWLDQGSPLRAGAYLTAALEATPEDYALRAKLAQLMLSLGKMEIARRDALYILSRSPNQGEALVVLAECIRTREDYKLAENEISKATDKQSSSYHLATANLLLRKGDRKGAQLSLLRARNTDPKSPLVLSALAAFHLSGGELPEAEKNFKAAADAAPLRSAARISYADFLLQHGKPKEAVALLEDMTKQAPDYLPTWITLAQQAFAQRDYARTTELLKQVTTRDPGNYHAHVLLAMVTHAKGDPTKAAADLEKLIATFPGLSTGSYQLALIRLQNKQVPAAKEALKAAIAAQSDHDQAIMLLAELNLQTGESEPVVEAMVGLLGRRPSLGQAQWLLTLALQAQGRLDDAVKVVRERIRITPTSAPLHFALGQIQVKQRDSDGARKSFEQALQLSPGFFPAAFSLVDLDLQTGRIKAALDLADSLRTEFPASPDAHFLSARVYAAKADWGQAEPLLRKTIEIDGNYTAAYGLLLYGLIANNRLSQAITELEALHAKTPDNLPVLMLSGTVYEQLSQPAKARSAYEAYLALKPDGSLALNNLALLYAEDPKLLDRALELARKAREVEPASAPIADTLGWIHFQRKEYAPAVQVLKESLAGLPDHPEVQFHYAMASMMNGDSKTAREYFQKAAAAKDDFKGKDQIAGHLATLPASP